MVKVEIKEPEVRPTPPPNEVVLRMDAMTASYVMSLVGNVFGEGPAREAYTNVFNALHATGRLVKQDRGKLFETFPRVRDGA